MKLNDLFTDDRAVSPVIGVILMVAITVILAAVIGAFVLGLGGSTDAAPQATFNFGYDGSSVTVTHQGGDGIDVGQIQINAGGTSASGFTDSEMSDTDTNWQAGETLTAGIGSSGDTVQVIWQSPNSDSTNVIGEGTA